VLGVEALENWKDFTQQELPGISEGMPVFPHRKKGFSEKEQLQELEAARPLLRHMVKRFTKNGLLEYSEAMQEAILGFLKAMQRYDPEKGRSLRSYASFWIVDSLQAACNRNLLLHVPLGVTKAILAEYRAEQSASLAVGKSCRRQPSAGSKSFVPKKFEHSVASKNAAVRALCVTYFAKRSSEADTSDESSLNQRLDAELSKTKPDGSDQINDQVNFKQVMAYLSRLSPLQQRVLCLRFLQEMTLEEIGQCLGISREGVRQTQERGLANLRKYLGVAPCEGIAPRQGGSC
jgi:RNA polymerase sigma factor (sigma-70 family)